MHTRSIWALVLALLFLLPAATVEGQKVQPNDRGPWEINLFAGGFDDDFEFDPDGSDPSWHAFVLTGDSYLDISVADGVAATFLLGLDPSGGPHDYDLYLYDDQFQLIDSSTNPPDWGEKIVWTITQRN